MHYSFVVKQKNFLNQKQFLNPHNKKKLKNNNKNNDCTV